MDISQLARNHSKLTTIIGLHCSDAPRDLAAVIFSFENGSELILSVNPEDDSLLWRRASLPGLTPVPLDETLPMIKAAYGLHLVWAWEMKNHQGYFDALQIELSDESLQRDFILQFKAVASSMKIFEVTEVY